MGIAFLFRTGELWVLLKTCVLVAWGRKVGKKSCQKKKKPKNKTTFNSWSCQTSPTATLKI